MANPIKIVSWNVKGLRSTSKRMRVRRHLKRLRADVALLQETHLSEQDFHRMRRVWVGEVRGSSARDKKGGVLILIHKQITTTVEKEAHDDDSRMVRLTLGIGLDKITLIYIYAPNAQTYQEMLGRLSESTNLIQVVGRDFNNVMDNELDRRNMSGRQQQHKTTRGKTTLLRDMA